MHMMCKGALIGPKADGIFMRFLIIDKTLYIYLPLVPMTLLLMLPEFVHRQLFLTLEAFNHRATL